MSTYDPKKVKLSFAGMPIEGYAIREADKAGRILPAITVLFDPIDGNDVSPPLEVEEYLSAEQNISLSAIGPPPPPPICVWDADTVTAPAFRVGKIDVAGSNNMRAQEIEEELEWINDVIAGSSRAKELLRFRDDLTAELAQLRKVTP